MIFGARLTSQTERDVRALYTEIIWAGLGAAVLGNFLNVFALRLGATDSEIGLLNSLPAVVGIILPIPAARLINRYWSKVILILPLALYRLIYPLLFLVPWLPSAMRVPALIGVVLVQQIPLVVFNVGFVAFLADVLPTEIRARVFSLRNTFAGITGTISVFLSGKALDTLVFPVNFQLLLGIGFITAQMSTWYVSHVGMPPRRVKPPSRRFADIPDHGDDATRHEHGTHRNHALTGNRAAFWWYTGSAIVFYMGLFLPIALYPILLVRDLHASNSWIGALGTLGGISSIILAPLWGRLSSRRGNRFALVLSGALFAVVPVAAGFVPSVVAYIPIALASGGLQAGINLSLFQCLLDTTPDEDRAHYVGVYSTIVNVAIAGGPILGTTLLSTIGLRPTFLLAAALLAAGSGLFAYANRYKLVRPSAAATVPIAVGLPAMAASEQ